MKTAPLCDPAGWADGRSGVLTARPCPCGSPGCARSDRSPWGSCASCGREWTRLPWRQPGNRPRAAATICHRRQHWAQMARQPRAAQVRGHCGGRHHNKQSFTGHRHKPLPARSPAQAGTAPGTGVSSACTGLPAHHRQDRELSPDLQHTDTKPGAGDSNTTPAAHQPLLPPSTAGAHPLLPLGASACSVPLQLHPGWHLLLTSTYGALLMAPADPVSSRLVSRHFSHVTTLQLLSTGGWHSNGISAASQLCVLGELT